MGRHKCKSSRDSSHPDWPVTGSCGETVSSLAALPSPFGVGLWLNRAEKNKSTVVLDSMG